MICDQAMDMDIRMESMYIPHEIYVHSIYFDEKKAQEKCIALNLQNFSMCSDNNMEEIKQEIDKIQTFEQKMYLMQEIAEDADDVKFYYIVKSEIVE